MPARLFAIKIANLVKKPMTLPKKVIEAQCTLLQTKILNELRDVVSAVQLYQCLEFEEAGLERFYAVAGAEGTKKAPYWSKQAQFNDKYDKWKPQFIKRMSKYTFIGDDPLERIFKAKHRTYMIPPNAPSILAAPYLAGLW